MSLKSLIYKLLHWHSDYNAVRKGKIGMLIKNKLIGWAMGRLMRR